MLHVTSSVDYCYFIITTITIYWDTGILLLYSIV